MVDIYSALECCFQEPADPHVIARPAGSQQSSLDDAPGLTHRVLRKAPCSVRESRFGKLNAAPSGPEPHAVVLHRYKLPSQFSVVLNNMTSFHLDFPDTV